MTLCIVETRGVFNLEPLTLTRPAFELWCGACPLLERLCRAFTAQETGVVVRPALAELCRLQRPGLAVNDADWIKKNARVLVDSRWLPPPEPLQDVATPRVGCLGEEAVFAVLPAPGGPELTFDSADEVLAHWKKLLPRGDAGGTILAFPWDIVDCNPQTLQDDWHWLQQHANKVQTGVEVIGPRDQLVVDPSVSIDPYVVADTRKGPVILEEGAAVHSFSRLEGPCYVGSESWILGAKLRGGTIGPRCRIGGEVEASIVHAHSNKYHDGFLGHSYVGEWVNLAAGTQTSDLRNDYGPIRVRINGVRTPTARTKIGSYIGDHTKTGLNTLLNCGSAIGAFCNLLPTGTYLPTTIPSFTLCGEMMTEQWDLRQLFQTASVAMRRRGCELTDVHTNMFFHLFETTSELRQRLHRDHEQRRLRRSV
jgi:UDP-N-acetylglucosamine diphosphorylase / glucose-1-phosphate thymidylyltransferase / UDP-N-acetylgalactosamine diphosphorylase / glucosamine-1-phosphate N-acetyltransferase / galactosamine-1-phosphate N-acetyltransferase